MAEPHYPNLFAPAAIGSVEVSNRIVFAGHGSRFVDWHEHHLVQRQADYLAERAKGGAGLIIQGSSMVHPTGLAAGAGVNEVWTDDSIPSYRDGCTRRCTMPVAKIFGQLSHLGRQGNSGSRRTVSSGHPRRCPDPASRIVSRMPDGPSATSPRSSTPTGIGCAPAPSRPASTGSRSTWRTATCCVQFLSRFSNQRTDRLRR